MAIKPILFNTDMVRAILDGRKTCTRRVVKPQWEECPHCKYVHNEYIYDKLAQNVYCARCGYPMEPERKAPYKPGDILYVRETWGIYTESWLDADYFMYKADYPANAATYTHQDGTICDLPRWRPSIHMPKEAARIWLKVTNVRVERLNEITDKGAEREGAQPDYPFDYDVDKWPNLEHFKKIWNSTIKKSDIDRYGWDANPYVFVIEFVKIDKPEVV